MSEIKQLGDVQLDNRNANKGKPRGQKQIVGSLQRNGFGRSGLLDRNGRAIAGNKTTEAAVEVFGVEAEPIIIQTDGKRPVYVQRTDLDLDDPNPNNPARRLAYEDNLSSYFSFELDPEIVSVDMGLGFDFEAIDVSLSDLSVMLEGAADSLLGGVKDVEPQIDKAAELKEKWGTESGQVWQLGEHRIACGDCTDPPVVESVMRGERAQALITDPPFNVRDDEWDTFKGDEAFIDFTSKWLSLANPISDTQVCFMADKNVPQLFLAAARSSLSYRRALIWRKPPGSQFAGASLDGFWFDFEIIQVFGKPTFEPDKHTKMAVLEHRTVTGQDHGCEKPSGLLGDLVDGYSQPGKIVVDFFCGTGSVLLACHQLGRKARGIEISPSYTAVILQRFVDATGKDPVLLSE